MTFALLGSLIGALLGWLMGFLSLFLILLILIQRGKGGGLTGALGGPGGQSAFGSKAGDTFTVITIVVACLWGFTCALAMLLLGSDPVSSTVAEETKVQAGPSQEEDVTDNLIIPPTGGLGGAISDSPTSPGETTLETPSMDLTPARPADSGSESPAPAESPAPTESPAETQPAAEAPAEGADAAATESSDNP